MFLYKIITKLCIQNILSIKIIYKKYNSQTQWLFWHLISLAIPSSLEECDDIPPS